MPNFPSARSVDLLMRETGAATVRIVTPPETTFAVVVTAHRPYVPFLLDVLVAWFMENPGGELILALDGVEASEFPDPSAFWTVIRGNWGHPADARNAALDHVTAEWVHFWDADNEVPRDIGASARAALSGVAHEAGYLGPWCTPGADARDAWGIDTNGLWRTRAVRMAGGWPRTWLEDWALGVRVQGIGFRAERWASGAVRRDHPGQRGKTRGKHEAVWSARVLSVITLQRTVSGFRKWVEAWARQRKPSPDNLRLIIGCEGADVEMEARLATFATLGAASVTIWNTGSTAVSFGSVPEPVRHSRVSGLFLRAAQYISRESSIVLTWEDDVFPDRDDAIEALSLALPVESGIGAVASAYPGRQNTKFAVASRRADRWEGVWRMDELPDHPIDVGTVGAGFTLWRASVLETISGAVQRPEVPLGWDACASAEVHRSGRRVLLHGGVKCAHGAY
jgi:hypothetical protein